MICFFTSSPVIPGGEELNPANRFLTELKKVFSEKCSVLFICSDPEEYDKTYIVDRNTIDIPILDCSEYVILHRPYFAMEGYTPMAWGLNPCQKTGSDAVKQAEPSISFEEFLSMFEADKKQVKS